MSDVGKNSNAKVERILKEISGEIRNLKQVDELRHIMPAEYVDQILSNIYLYLESQTLREFYGVEGEEFREILYRLIGDPKSKKLYFIDILGAHAWATPLFQVFLYEHVLRYVRRNYSNGWNLEFTDEIIRNKIEERLAVGNIDIDDVLPDYSIGDPIDLHMIRVLTWEDEDMKSAVAKNLIDLHRVFNIPLFYFPPGEFGIFRVLDFNVTTTTLLFLDFHVVVDENDKVLPSGCWIYYEKLTRDGRRQRKRVPYSEYDGDIPIDPYKFFKEILQHKKCVFALEKRKELLNQLELRNNIFFINSPSRDLGGFRGAPTSLLYAIGPLVEEIKSKKIKISSFSSQNIFDPIHYKDTLYKDLKKRLKLVKPNIAGISTTSDAFHVAREIAEQVKEYNKDIIVILGGPHVDEVDFDLKKNPNNPLLYDDFDFAISGDGEYMLLELVRMIIKGWETLPAGDIDAIKEYIIQNEKSFKDVEGFARLYFKYEGEQVNIPSSMKQLDLNLLPPLRYEYLKKEHLRDFDVFKDHEGNIERCVQIMTHRGCGSDCNFCSERILLPEKMGYFNASKSVSRIVDEIWHYINKSRIRVVFFDDSTFIEKKGFVKELCKELIDSGLSKKIRWGCLNRFDKVRDSELIRNMVDAGLTYMYMGLEVFDDNALHNMKKHPFGEPQMTDIIENALEILKSNGVKTGVSLLFGYPHARFEAEKKTIEFVGNMVKQKKIHLLSLSLFNYHLMSSITTSSHRQHEFNYGEVSMEIIEKQNKPPWNCFEEGGWFHSGLRKVNENYLWEVLHVIDENIEDKSVLVRENEFRKSMKLLDEREKEKEKKKPRKREA